MPVNLAPFCYTLHHGKCIYNMGRYYDKIIIIENIIHTIYLKIFRIQVLFTSRCNELTDIIN